MMIDPWAAMGGSRKSTVKFSFTSAELAAWTPGLKLSLADGGISLGTHHFPPRSLSPHRCH